MPNSTFKVFWNYVVILLMMYTVTLMPYKLSFFDNSTDSSFDIIENIV